MLPGRERSVLFPVGLLTQVTGTVKKTEAHIFSQGEKLKDMFVFFMGHMSVSLSLLGKDFTFRFWVSLTVDKAETPV